MALTGSPAYLVCNHLAKRGAGQYSSWRVAGVAAMRRGRGESRRCAGWALFGLRRCSGRALGRGDSRAVTVASSGPPEGHGVGN
ncbi:hypothetical protein E2C01_047384 [Portunus trituberculatus]|uniref:Uncharacterized protein n=1 Tax=Portunus trituberculatus TaxID=210409 RepID=A0A5B7G098_PORTR|nr:hypothetical protein [Portunus trituberculatus]